MVLADDGDRGLLFPPFTVAIFVVYFVFILCVFYLDFPFYILDVLSLWFVTSLQRGKIKEVDKDYRWMLA